VAAAVASIPTNYKPKIPIRHWTPTCPVMPR